MADKIFSPETYSMIGQWAIGFCKDLVVAVIVFIIGNWLIKWMKKLIKKILTEIEINRVARRMARLAWKAYKKGYIL